MITTQRATSPKSENMDGDSFAAWLWKVHQSISKRAAAIAVYQEGGRDWATAAFNCNYDAETAAYEWLRKQLDTATPVIAQ